MSDVFQGLQRGHYGVVYVDAPLRFKTFDNATTVAARATRQTGDRALSDDGDAPHHGAAGSGYCRGICAPLLWTSPPFLAISLGSSGLGASLTRPLPSPG